MYETSTYIVKITYFIFPKFLNKIIQINLFVVILKKNILSFLYKDYNISFYKNTTHGILLTHFRKCWVFVGTVKQKHRYILWPSIL